MTAQFKLKRDFTPDDFSLVTPFSQKGLRYASAPIAIGGEARGWELFGQPRQPRPIARFNLNTKADNRRDIHIATIIKSPGDTDYLVPKVDEPEIARAVQTAIDWHTITHGPNVKQQWTRMEYRRSLLEPFDYAHIGPSGFNPSIVHIDEALEAMLTRQGRTSSNYAMGSVIGTEGLLLPAGRVHNNASLKDLFSDLGRLQRQPEAFQEMPTNTLLGWGGEWLHRSALYQGAEAKTREFLWLSWSDEKPDAPDFRPTSRQRPLAAVSYHG